MSTHLGRKAMIQAAAKLPAAPTPAPDGPQVYFLTGRSYYYQTAFCAMSLARVTGRGLRVVIVDDGTLSRKEFSILSRILPSVRFICQEEIASALDRRLPFREFPELRRRRLVYPHIRKLTDVHAAGGGWKLVLDSDMLFHQKPDFLLHWLAAPDRACHMVDVADAYGYSPSLLRSLIDTDVPERLNVGVCGLLSDAIDWVAMERHCSTLIAKEGTHYLLEQALVALATASQPRAVAPMDQYIVAPSREETRHPSGILHHYTAEAKAWYFRYGWRHFADN